MWWFKAALLAVALTLPVAVAAGSFGSLVFDQNDPETIVMAEEAEGMRGGEMRFIEIDPVNLAILRHKFGVSKEPLHGRLKTRNEALQVSGEDLIWSGFSPFSATKKPARVYAFDEMIWPGAALECPYFATPLFRFKAGTANLVPISALPLDNYAAPRPFTEMISGETEHYRRYSAGETLADAQTVLDERPGIKAKVEYAEVLGFVAWKDADGELSGCNHKGEMVWVTPEMFKRLGPGRW